MFQEFAYDRIKISQGTLFWSTDDQASLTIATDNRPDFANSAVSKNDLTGRVIFERFQERTTGSNSGMAGFQEIRGFTPSLGGIARELPAS